MKTVLMMLLAVFSLQAQAEDPIVPDIPVASVSAVPTQEESKYNATTSVNGLFNKSLASEFQGKAVFVVQEGEDKFDAFVASVFVTHDIKLVKQEEDADVLVLIDDAGISYAHDGDKPAYAKYIPVATAPDQAATYDLLIANASVVRGPGGDGLFSGSPMEIVVKQAIFKIASSDAFANATHSNAKTGPFDQALWVNVTLKIKGEDGKYKSKSSSFVAKTKDEILRIKKEELFASALDCMMVCK